MNDCDVIAGQQILGTRDEKGLTQVKVAKEAGISHVTLREIERGDIKTLTSIRAAAAVLGLEVCLTLVKAE